MYAQKQRKKQSVKEYLKKKIIYFWIISDFCMLIWEPMTNKVSMAEIYRSEEILYKLFYNIKGGSLVSYLNCGNIIFKELKHKTKHYGV